MLKSTQFARCATMLFVFVATGVLLFSQPKPNLALANKVPLPAAGLIIVQDAILEGYSASTNCLVFATNNVSEGRGGFSDNFVFRIDAITGKERERVQTSFDSFDDPEADEVREKAMARNGMAALKRWGVQVPSQENYGKSGVTGLVARYPVGGAIEESGPVPVRFYIADAYSTWLKPLYDKEFAHLSDDSPDSVQFKESIELLGYKGLVVRFYRSPIMEFDSGTELFLCLSPQLYAQFLNEVGYAFYTQKAWDKALEWFARAVRADPGHATAQYNGACASALLNQVSSAVSYLEAIKAIGSPAAMAYLKKVAKDTDFDPIRAEPAFIAAIQRLQAGAK